MSPSPQAFRPYWALLPLSLLFLSSLAKLMAVQVLPTDKGKAKADKLVERAIPAPRGRILDRHGHVLAEDRAEVDLVQRSLPRDRSLVQALDDQSLTPDEVWERVAFLAEAIGAAPEEMWEVLVENPSACQVVRRGLNLAQERRIRRAMEAVPYTGLRLESHYRRVYPNGSSLAHVLGLAAAYEEQPGEQGAQLQSRPGTGLEGGMEAQLKGIPGFRRSLGVGRHYGVDPALDMQAPQPGQDVRTTLDVELASVARRALAEMEAEHQMERCFALVVDVRDGSLLTAVGLPDYDPNDPAGTLDRRVDPATGEEVEAGWTFPAKWYLEPGSTFKPLVAAYALDRGAISPTTTFSNFGGHYRPPHRGHAKGIENAIGVPDEPMTAREGIIYSSNVVFAQIAREVGREGMADILDHYGYHEQAFALDGLALTFNGRKMPPRSAFFKERSPDGMAFTVPTMGFGQGFQVSPMDHAMAMAAIANGGKLLRPRVLADAPVDLRGEIFAHASSAAFVREAMHAQAMKPGREQYLPHRELIDMCSKSGTSTIDYGPLAGSYTSLFTAYGPYEDPAVLVLVVAEGTRKVDRLGTHHFGIKVCGKAADAILYRALSDRGLLAAPSRMQQ